MFLPLRDSPNPSGVPVVNYLLLAVNILVFLAITLPMSSAAPDLTSAATREYVSFLGEQMGRPLHPTQVMGGFSAYDVFVYEYGYRPAAGSVQTMFTSMFMHGGFLHLAGNMLFLWIYGDNVEHRLGRPLYLIAYLATGVCATLFYSSFDLSSNVPLVGASGAISGVLGFYFLFFPHNTVKVFVAFIMVGVIDIRARIVLGVYLVLDNILPMLSASGSGSGSGGGVAHGAHIGGFVAGLAAAFFIDKYDPAWADPGAPIQRRRRQTPVHRGPGAGGSGSGGPAAYPSHFAALIDEGRMTEAAQVYFAGAEGDGLEPDPEDALALGRWLAENGHPTAALTVFRRVIKSVPQGPNAAWAHVGAGLVQMDDLDRPTAAYQHFLDALDLDSGGEAARIARAGIIEIDGSKNA